MSPVSSMIVSARICPIPGTVLRKLNSGRSLIRSLTVRSRISVCSSAQHMTDRFALTARATRHLEKELRANPESIRFHLEMAALDDARAKQFTEKDFWDSSLVEEIRRSGFIKQLYKN